MILPESLIKRNPAIIMGKVDQEYVMLSVENSEYYGLDEIGSRIWDCIEVPITLDQLVVTLQKEYDVEYDICLDDTREFLNKMIQRSMIIID